MLGADMGCGRDYVPGWLQPNMGRDPHLIQAWRLSVWMIISKKYLDERFKHLEEAVAELRTGRFVCQDEVFPRLKTMELQLATQAASSWRGAFIIGACSCFGAIIAVVVGHILMSGH